MTATDVDTKAARRGTSNAEGRFLFSQVNPGRYTVTVSAQGFAEQTSQPVAVDVGRTVTLNFRLVVSSAAQTVEVTANQELLEPGESEYHDDAGIEDDCEPAQSGPGPDLYCAVFAGSVDEYGRVFE